MKNSSKLVSFLVPVISILLAFIIGCVIMAILGANPFVALQSLWIGAFGSLRNVGTTLARSTPLIFTGLCACFAYRCGVFNLGGEGQFLMGSIVCCYIATQSGIEGLPAILLCLIGGAIGILLGIAAGLGLSAAMQVSGKPSLASILVAFGFSMAIGVFFGYYPANKAARLDPIEALRYE